MNTAVSELFPIPLETPEQNYWLGFLMGDGYIQGSKEKGYSLCVECAVRDAYHVSRFGRFVGKPAASHRTCVRVVKGCSKELGHLAKHGLILRKTGKECWPETVTHVGSFFRGIFDADGWVSEQKSSVQFGVCGASWEFLAKLGSVVSSELMLDITPRKFKNANCFSITCSLSGWRLQKLHKFLYQSPGEPRLHRKERIIRLNAFGKKARVH